MTESETSLLDILRFLESAYKTIASTGVLGLAVAITYLSITPKEYEAITQISMAQVSNGNNNPLGVNFEEPSMLIVRLSQPTSFTPQVIDICKAGSSFNTGAALTKSIKLTIPKGTPSMVELRTFGPSPQDAQSCAQAIFELIKTTQAQIMALYTEELRIKLRDDEDRLTKARELIIKADKTGSAMSGFYLSTRDEIRFLLDEITSLNNALISSQSRVTRLVAPIYVSDTPIAPKRRIVLMVGLLGGLSFGLLLALFSQMWIKLKTHMQEQG